jgi:hypothetical protein
LAAKARARTGRAIPDMSAWQQLTLPAGTDADAAIKELLASGQVSGAYVAPDPAPPPQTVPTPDFTSMQGIPAARAAGHRCRLLAQGSPHPRCRRSTSRPMGAVSTCRAGASRSRPPAAAGPVRRHRT